jgi:hypothetical protein
MMTSRFASSPRLRNPPEEASPPKNPTPQASFGWSVLVSIVQRVLGEKTVLHRVQQCFLNTTVDTVAAFDI